jgi:flagellar hook-associated protein 1 FlgK
LNPANKVTLQGINMDASTYNAMEQSRVIWGDSTGTAIDSNGNALANGSTLDINSNAAIFQPTDGELRGYTAAKNNIDDYSGQLDKLARALAFSVNAVHSGQTNADADEMPFFVNGDDATYTNNILNPFPVSTDVSESTITAKNITINKEILNDPMKIKTRTHDNQFATESANNIDGETDGARALEIAGLRDKLMTIQDIGNTTINRSDMFDVTKGGNSLDSTNSLSFSSNQNGMTMDNYFKDTIDSIGIQSQAAQRVVKNQTALLDNFEQSRASISGVSLDEEMANLVQFQHAYQANAKIVSTLDQLLDVVINGLKK